MVAKQAHIRDSAAILENMNQLWDGRAALVALILSVVALLSLVAGCNGADATPDTAPLVSPTPVRPLIVPTTGSATAPAVPTIAAPPTPGPTATLPRDLFALSSDLTHVTDPGVTDDELRQLIEGNTDFALRLYRSLVDENSNLIFSPYSISTALAMTYAGADGDTETQMAEALGFRLRQDMLHRAFNAQQQLLSSEGGGESSGQFELNIANAIWGQHNHEFLVTFLDTLAEQYGSEIGRADFSGDSEQARERINNWVSQQTQDRIQDLLPEGAIDTLTRLVLANAIYFKAGWLRPFEESRTSPRPFHTIDGETMETPMMRQAARFGYASGDGYQAVELPYKGGQFSMLVLVPDTGAFADFEEALDAKGMSAVVDGLQTRRILLTMPLFEQRSTADAKNALVGMGMKDAFDPTAADFSRMDTGSCAAGDAQCLHISDIAHQAYISVVESGTEAAAATAITVVVTSAELEPPLEMTIDRPFIYVIRHRHTGAFLFLGRVMNPE